MLQLTETRKRALIPVKVTGKRTNYNGIGLEIPSRCSFYHKKPSNVKKLIELITHKEGN